MNKQQITNLLTIILVAVWIISAVVRIWVSWPVASVLDGVMPLIIGYWFSTQAFPKSNEDKAVAA